MIFDAIIIIIIKMSNGDVGLNVVDNGTFVGDGGIFVDGCSAIDFSSPLHDCTVIDEFGSLESDVVHSMLEPLYFFITVIATKYKISHISTYTCWSHVTITCLLSLICFFQKIRLCIRRKTYRTYLTAV